MPRKKRAQDAAPPVCAEPAVEAALSQPPATVAALRDVARLFAGLVVPDRPIIESHAAPLEYLAHAFFEGRVPGRDPAPADCVVWAARGAGKTMLGALATALDLIFKPGIEIRVLGGSLDQSKRMHRYLRQIFERGPAPLAALLKGQITDHRLRLRSGSEVEVLAQSQTSVRGTRVQKLRCDEVDLFRPDILEAAQLTTRSRRCGNLDVRGTVECLSTMTIPHGVMARLVGEARSGQRTLLRWGVVDVLERCGPERACNPPQEDADAVDRTPARVSLPVLANSSGATCALWPECRGRAKLREAPGGHVAIADAITQKGRVSVAAWESEMLCLRPRRTDAALPEFDPALHVFTGPGPEGEGVWVAGMDFGLRSPTVILWARLVDGALWVMDERSEAGVLLASHVDALTRGEPAPGRGPWPRPAWIGIDPAGAARNDQTGRSPADLLRDIGIEVRWRRMHTLRGLERVRAWLLPAAGSPHLFIHERCTTLIASMERYRYDPNRPDREEPLKGEGWDHAVDALRYMVTNAERPAVAKCGRYA